MVIEDEAMAFQQFQKLFWGSPTEGGGEGVARGMTANTEEHLFARVIHAAHTKPKGSIDFKQKNETRCSWSMQWFADPG